MPDGSVKRMIAAQCPVGQAVTFYSSISVAACGEAAATTSYYVDFSACSSSLCNAPSASALATGPASYPPPPAQSQAPVCPASSSVSACYVGVSGPPAAVASFKATDADGSLPSPPVPLTLPAAYVSAPSICASYSRRCSDLTENRYSLSFLNGTKGPLTGLMCPTGQLVTVYTYESVAACPASMAALASAKRIAYLNLAVCATNNCNAPPDPPPPAPASALPPPPPPPPSCPAAAAAASCYSGVLAPASAVPYFVLSLRAASAAAVYPASRPVPPGQLCSTSVVPCSVLVGKESFTFPNNGSRVFLTRAQCPAGQAVTMFGTVSVAACPAIAAEVASYPAEYAGVAFCNATDCNAPPPGTHPPPAAAPPPQAAAAAAPRSSAAATATAGGRVASCAQVALLCCGTALLLAAAEASR